MKKVIFTQQIYNEVRCKGFMRAYSLGIIIVAITVGSQVAVTRCLEFEGKAAGFWTWTLLIKVPKYATC